MLIKMQRQTIVNISFTNSGNITLNNDLNEVKYIFLPADQCYILSGGGTLSFRQDKIFNSPVLSTTALISVP